MHLDQNECEISNGGCQHQCKNVNGSFVCHCNEGFFLDSNGKSCSGKHEISIRVSKIYHRFYGGACYLLVFIKKTIHLKLKAPFCIHEQLFMTFIDIIMTI